MNLSKRLFAIASMVPKGLPLADIGADHGYLEKYLLENKIVPFCYACENKKGPFERLKNNLVKYIEQGLVDVKFEDGLNHLSSQIKTVVIAGMGGDLIYKIINKNLKCIEFIEYFILAPHGNEYLLRKFLNNNGYFILDEKIVFENHFYEIIIFKKGNKSYSEFQLKYGPINLEKKDNEFIDKYQKLICLNKQLLTNSSLSSTRRDEIENQIYNFKQMLNSINKKDV